MLDMAFSLDTGDYGLDQFKADLAQLPSITDAQADYLVRQLRRAQREAEAASARAAKAAQVGPRPVVTGIGVVGLLARNGR